jgi:hypothetical protein
MYFAIQSTSQNERRAYLSTSSCSCRGSKANMETPCPGESHGLSEQESSTFRSSLPEAIRYWEPRRIIYNLSLLAVCIAWFAPGWQHFRPTLTWSSLPPVAVLALLANVCYCAAYLVDLPLQQSSLGSVWRRRRWALWLVGTLFAIVLASYWINDEIYPAIR